MYSFSICLKLSFYQLKIDNYKYKMFYICLINLTKQTSTIDTQNMSKELKHTNTENH